MTYVVGVTGGIASGKTTVANLFRDQFGIGLVDADVVARNVVEPGTPGLQKIADHFGQLVLNKDGSLNRAELRQRIFSNEKEKTWLNGLLHPLIRQEMTRELKEVKSPYALLVVPLLVENQLQSMTDRILVVDVSKEIQIKRTMMRDNVSRTQVESILASQANREQRLASADDIIQNDKDSAALLARVTQLHEQYLALSGQTP